MQMAPSTRRATKSSRSLGERALADIILKKKKSSPVTTVLLFMSFGAVLLILFNPGLRNALGQYAGYAFTPLLGFGGAYPLLTILLASIILVVSTTAIRHFLVDWVNMARVPEAIRSFQKEFSHARTPHNTYTIKKPTDSPPQILPLQSTMSLEQMRDLGTVDVITPATEIAMSANGPWVALSTLAIYPEVFPAKPALGFKRAEFDEINHDAAPVFDVDALEAVASREARDLHASHRGSHAAHAAAYPSLMLTVPALVDLAICLPRATSRVQTEALRP